VKTRIVINRSQCKIEGICPGIRLRTDLSVINKDLALRTLPEKKRQELLALLKNDYVDTNINALAYAGDRWIEDAPGHHVLQVGFQRRGASLEADQEEAERTGRRSHGNWNVRGHKAKRLRSLCRVYLYDMVKQSFPIGLLALVERILKEEGLRYEVVDQTPVPERVLDLQFNWEGMERRTYQEEMFQALISNRVGRLACATNSGKTPVMCRAIAHHGTRALVLVQGKELMEQICQEMSRYIGYPPGRFGGRWREIKPVTVAIINSAVKEAGNWGELFDDVYVDEGHHGTSATHEFVLQKINPYRLYSLTGTDYKEDTSAALLYEATFGQRLYQVTNQQMRALGYSSPLTARFTKVNSTAAEREALLNRDWRQIYTGSIVKNKKRNKLIAETAAGYSRQGFQTLVVVNHHDQGMAIMGELFLMSGIDPPAFMSGRRGDVAREKARRRFAEGSLRLLVGTGIYDEGMNFPNLQVIVLAGGMKGQRVTAQRLGRGQRLQAGKEQCIIHDFLDTGHRLLVKHSIKRLSTMKINSVEIPAEVESMFEDYVEG
jgi:superfamily II DNA or RNA helicase